VLAPEHEVVHLLDLDSAEPVELAPVLLSSFLDRARPDLGRDGQLVAAVADDAAHRSLGRAVHRRGVDDAAAGVERRADDVAGERGVVLEGCPRAEPDDGA
jgi:hypothetical protein